MLWQGIVVFLWSGLAVLSGGAESKFCNKSDPCQATVCPGQTQVVLCSEDSVNLDFFVSDTFPISFELISGKPFCTTYSPRSGRSSVHGIDDINCNLTYLQLVAMLVLNTNCYNRSYTSCSVTNPESLKGLICNTSERELSFWYYCQPREEQHSSTRSLAAPTLIASQTAASSATTLAPSTTVTSTAASTTFKALLPPVTAATTGPTVCPAGKFRLVASGACAPTSSFVGTECRDLATIYGSVYQTENGSCANIPDSVTSVNDTLKSTGTATVKAQLLSKFAGTQNFSNIQDLSGFAQLLSEQLPTVLSGDSSSGTPPTTQEVQATVKTVLSTVVEFSSKGLWTNSLASGRFAELKLPNLTRAADTVLRAIDSLGQGLQDQVKGLETKFSSDGIGLALRRLTSQSAVAMNPDPDIAVKVLFSGDASSRNVSVVTTSVDLPSLLQWLRTPASNQRLVSRVVQASLFAPGSGKLPTGGSAMFLVPHSNGLRMQRTRRSCMFVDSNGVLSSDGCDVVLELSNATHTACLCRHLTSFAVVASPGEDWLSVETRQLLERHSKPLRVLTYACLSVSVVCLMLTCMAYMFLRVKSPNAEGSIVTLYQVHRALCATLLAAQLLFVVSFERVEFGRIPCQVLSAITLYAFLAVFTWLLCEGFLYTKSLIIVLPKADSAFLKVRFWHYCLICYMIPAVITAAVVGIRHDQLIQLEADFTSPDSLQSPKVCWLSSDFGTRWGFLGPMLTVCGVNLVLFAVILARISRRDLAYAAHSEQSPGLAKMLRRQLRVSLTLGALLGLSWLISLLFLFAQMELLLAANYLFILLNGLQGCFLFVTKVVTQRRFRDAIERWLLQSRVTPQRLRQWLESLRAARLSGSSNNPATSNSGNTSKVTENRWKVAVCCRCLRAEDASGVSSSTSAEASNISISADKTPPQALASPGHGLPSLVGHFATNEPLGLSQPPMAEVKSIIFYDTLQQRCGKVSHF